MQRARAAERAAQPPAPLPAGPAPPAGAMAAPLPDLAGPVGDPVLLWSAEDFRDAAPELVELAEAWRVDVHTKRAVAGQLPRRVVDEIAKDAAFPAGSKRSLSTASPVTLAKMFNALRVPLSLKAVITVAPALVYIIVRDLQFGSRIEKLIATERARAAAPLPAPKPPEKK